MNEINSTSYSNQSKRKALILDPKFILDPLEKAVAQKLENSKEKVINYYEYNRGMTLEQCNKYLKHKKWFQMLYNQKDMQNLISIFGIYLTYSDVLVVPDYILDVIKTSNTPELNIKEKNPHFDIKENDSKELLLRKKNLQDLKDIYKEEIENERSLLQELKELEIKLHNLKENLAFKRQQAKFYENREHSSNISSIFRLSYNDMQSHEDNTIREKLSNLKKDCDQLELETDHLIQYPAINYWEEDPNSILINRTEMSHSLYNPYQDNSFSDLPQKISSNSENLITNNNINNSNYSNEFINLELRQRNKNYYFNKKNAIILDNDIYAEFNNSFNPEDEKDDFEFLEESLKNVN